MTIEAHGHVTSVARETDGDELTVAAAAGATVLTVRDVADFDEDGGTVRLDDGAGTLRDYVSITDQPPTLTLASAIPTSLAAGTRVDVWDTDKNAPTVVYKATITDDVTGEPLDADVSHDLIDKLESSVRAGFSESVVCHQDEAGRWSVVDVLGRIPVSDGTFINPETLPPPTEPYVPTEPPPNPDIEVRGLTRGLIIQITNTEPGSDYDLLFNKYTITGGVALASWTVTTKRTSNYITTEGDGSPMQFGFEYAVEVVARNAAGESFGGERSGSLVREDSSTIAELSIDLLTSGILDAAVALAGAIQVGGPNGITIEPGSGITIPQPGGGKIQFPSNGTRATIDADVIARTATFLGGVNWRGTDNQLAGRLNLGNGVPNPAAAPTVGPSWASTAPLASQPSKTTGLCDTSSGTSWVTLTGEGLGTGDAGLAEVNKGTGVATAVATKPWMASFNANGGITRVGTSFFVLGRDRLRDYFYIYRLDSSYNKTAEWAVVRDFPARPAIGTDGTDVLMAYTASSGMYVRRYTTAGTPGTLTQVAYGGTALLPIGGVYGGIENLPGGSTPRYWVATQSGTFYCFLATTGARDPDRDYVRAESNTLRGLWWDGTRFWSLATGGRIYQYSRHPGGTFVYAYTWYDSDSGGAGFAETMSSPSVTSAVVPRGARPTVTVTAPPDDGTSDGANTAHVYACVGGGTLARQTGSTGLPEGTYVLALDVVGSGTALPGSSGFASRGASVPGSIASAIGGFSIDGIGNGSVGTGTFRTSVDARVSSVAPTVVMTSGSVGTGAFRDSVRSDIAAGGGTANWANLTISSPFTAVSGQTPEYRKDAAGNVHLRGAVNRVTASSGALVATLPAGFRPTASVFGIVRTNTIGVTAQIAVNTAGQIAVSWSGTPSALGIEIVFSTL